MEYSKPDIIIIWKNGKARFVLSHSYLEHYQKTKVKPLIIKIPNILKETMI